MGYNTCVNTSRRGCRTCYGAAVRSDASAPTDDAGKTIRPSRLASQHTAALHRDIAASAAVLLCANAIVAVRRAL